MSPAGRSVRLVALMALTAAALVVAQEPVYVDRLQLPVARDDIGFGFSVTADLHTSEIFVCDPRTNRILIFDPEGYFTFQILGGGDFGSPQDLAVDPEGLLLVLASRGDRQTVVELDFDGAFRREVPLRELPAGLEIPRYSSLALSPDGTRIYRLDGRNLHLWITDRDGNLERAVDLLEAMGDYLGDPFVARVDVYGDQVLVAVPSEGSILRFDLAGELVDAIGAKGTSPCMLGRAEAAASNDRGELLVIDRQRMVLTRWSTRNRRCLSEHLGIGAATGFLYYPNDMALDSRGRLYIAQSYKGRVQIFEGMGAAPGAPGPSPATAPEDGGP